MHINALLVFAAALLCGVSFVNNHFSRRAKALRKIPGPSGLPLIGNLHQISSLPFRELKQWSRKYGEIFRLKAGLQDWIFLNSPEAIKDILDRQSATTSGRPPMPVASDIVSGGKRFLLMSYTPEWRKLRAMVHKLLTPKASDLFKPSQEFETKQLLWDLLTDNVDQESFYNHVRRYTTSVVMTSTYGRRIPFWDCEDVREIYGLMKDFSDSMAPGAYLAEAVHVLAKLPVWMQWWRPSALKHYERQKHIWMKYWNNLMLQISLNQAPSCFVKQFAEIDLQKQGIDEVQAAFVAGTMIEAGSETTSANLNGLIRCLAATPSVQDIAHEELSRVIGGDRLPNYSDEESLPYIRAIVKEILRLRPVSSLGSPHYTTADIMYKDTLIPKDTVIWLNQWGAHYSTERWHNPEAFDPSRYLGYPLKAGAYAGIADPNERDHFGFGAGRRICPGMHLAENSLFITVASILWLFEIKPPVNEAGVEEPVTISDEDLEPGGNVIPKTFRVRFIPRSERRVQVLREAWATAQKEGFKLGGIEVNLEGVVV